MMGSKSKQNKKHLPAKVEQAQLPATINAPTGLVQSIASMDFAGVLTLSETLIKSGLMPDAIKTKEQAAVIILKGAELHIPPMQALSTINVIVGKPTLSAQLMLGLAKQRIPGFKAVRVQSTDKICVYKFQRPGESEHEETWTIERAARMKTKEKVRGESKTIPLTDKFNWRTMPQTMLEWRCISSGLRVVCPDIIMGLYTPEEMDPNVKVLNQSSGDVEMAEADYEIKNGIKDVPQGGRLSLRAPEPEPEDDDDENKRYQMKAELNALPKEQFLALCKEFGITSEAELADKLEDLYAKMKGDAGEPQDGGPQSEQETATPEAGPAPEGSETVGPGSEEEATPAGEVEPEGGLPII